MERAAIELLKVRRPHLGEVPERFLHVESAVDSVEPQLHAKARDTVRNRDRAVHETLYPPAILREICDLQLLVASAVDNALEGMPVSEAVDV